MSDVTRNEFWSMIRQLVTLDSESLKKKSKDEEGDSESVKGNQQNEDGGSKRKELQKYKQTTSHQNYLPHYCNFVRSKTLHNRPLSPTHPGTGTGLGDDVSQELLDLENDSSLQTDRDGPGGAARNGGIIRAMSPGSQGYDPSALFDKLREEGLAGSTSALNTTRNESQDGDTTMGDEMRAHTPVTEVRVVTSPGGGRLPIQIQLPDSTDKGKTSGRDSARSTDVSAMVEGLVSEKVKDVKNASRSPTTSAQGSGKSKSRRSCAKKEKVMKERKKKGGKKKDEAEDLEKTGDGSGTSVTPGGVGGKENLPGGPGVTADGTPVTGKAPDLPNVATSAKEKAKIKRRKTKSQILAPKSGDQKKGGILLQDDKTASFYEFGALGTEGQDPEDSMPRTVNVPSYLSDRMVLSLSSSRFQLPMDMKTLEKMSPQDYLRKHCVITTRRKTLYNKIYQKHKDKTGSMHGKVALSKALREVLVNTISPDQVDDLCTLLEVDDVTNIDLQLFSGTAALAERILYPDFVTEDTVDMPEYHREKVECADFCSLDWKLHGIEINGHVRKILETLG